MLLLDSWWIAIWTFSRVGVTSNNSFTGTCSCRSRALSLIEWGCFIHDTNAQPTSPRPSSSLIWACFRLQRWAGTGWTVDLLKTAVEVYHVILVCVTFISSSALSGILHFARWTVVRMLLRASFFVVRWGSLKCVRWAAHFYLWGPWSRHGSHQSIYSVPESDQRWFHISLAQNNFFEPLI